MSRYASLYIGPYLRVKTKPGTETIEYWGCPNLHHTQTEDAFCRKCGEKIRKLSRTQSVNLGFYQFMNDDEVDHDEILHLEDMLFDPSVLIDNQPHNPDDEDYDILYPNHEGLPGTHVN